MYRLITTISIMCTHWLQALNTKLPLKTDNEATPIIMFIQIDTPINVGLGEEEFKYKESKMCSPDQDSVQGAPILVTGFGLFHDYEVNASWEAVKELKRLGVAHRSSAVPLETREIPVAYKDVSTIVPKLYDELNPRLCVHVGVSLYRVVMLEKCGKNCGYVGQDIFNRTPSTNVCVSDGPKVLPSQFDVDSVCEKLRQKVSDVAFDVSEDAGRYLCDFLYYTSLHVNRAPVLFVHVPDLDTPYSTAQLGHTLKILIETLLEEL